MQFALSVKQTLATPENAKLVRSLIEAHPAPSRNQLAKAQVHCANLASHTLALCTRRVSEDFERRYHLCPWLLESFVETPTYDGACYKAANWIGVGPTKGRGRNGSNRPSKRLKEVYLYALVKDFSDRVADSWIELGR